MTFAGRNMSAANAALIGALLVGATAAGVLPWYVPLTAIPIAMAVFRRPWTLLCGIVFLLGLGAFRLRTALTTRPELGTRDIYGRSILVTDDARISRVPGSGGEVRAITAKLRSCGDLATGQVFPGNDAPAVLVLPENSPAPPCGTVIEAEGTVSVLAGADDRDDFIARLKRRGVTVIVRCDKFRRIGRETGIRTLLADGRDALLRRLFDGVSSPEVRKLAAGLCCGISSGIPGEVRKDFAAAGIIHIFSVSGMHVAVLALCFAWLLRTLPFRQRGPILAALVWLYVLATGAGTPAVRAGTMVTLWVLLRTCLLRLRGSDVLAWTAALLIVLDPMLVVEPGAQYSFLITGALLLLAERRRLPRRDEPDFVPSVFASRLRRAADKFPARAKALVIGAGTAFLAGAAVSLQTHRRHLGTGAVAANILLALLMPGFFALFFIQLFMGLCGAGRFTAPAFEWAFLRLGDFAAFFAEYFPDAGAAPPHWSVTAVYILALLVLLRSGRRAVRIVAAVVLGGIFVWQLAKPYTLPPAVLVSASNYGRPPLVALADPARRRATVVNSPDAGSARRAAEFLRRRGIREVELLFASSPAGVPGRGAAGLESELKVRRRLAGDAKSPGGPCRLTPFKTGFRLDYFDPGSKLCFGIVVTAGDAGYEVAVEHRGKRVSHRLPWSIDREDWEYELTD